MSGHEKIIIPILILLFGIGVASILFSGHNKDKYRIRIGDYTYLVENYTEHDGCIYFDDAHACGNYLVTTL